MSCAPCRTLPRSSLPTADGRARLARLDRQGSWRTSRWPHLDGPAGWPSRVVRRRQRRLAGHASERGSASCQSSIATPGRASHCCWATTGPRRHVPRWRVAARPRVPPDRSGSGTARPDSLTGQLVRTGQRSQSGPTRATNCSPEVSRGDLDAAPAASGPRPRRPAAAGRAPSPRRRPSGRRRRPAGPRRAGSPDRAARRTRRARPRAGRSPAAGARPRPASTAPSCPS